MTYLVFVFYYLLSASPLELFGSRFIDKTYGTSKAKEKRPGDEVEKRVRGWTSGRSLRLRASGRNNSKHCCANNVEGCCVCVGSGVQTDATTPKKSLTRKSAFEVSSNKMRPYFGVNHFFLGRLR